MLNEFRLILAFYKYSFAWSVSICIARSNSSPWLNQCSRPADCTSFQWQWLCQSCECHLNFPLLCLPGKSLVMLPATVILLCNHSTNSSHHFAVLFLLCKLFWAIYTVKKCPPTFLSIYKSDEKNLFLKKIPEWKTVYLSNQRSDIYFNL